jgi:uncharacterized protein (UPF0248 family)
MEKERLLDILNRLMKKYKDDADTYVIVANATRAVKDAYNTADICWDTGVLLSVARFGKYIGLGEKSGVPQEVSDTLEDVLDMLAMDIPKILARCKLYYQRKR